MFKTFYDSGWHHPAIALVGVLLALVAFASRHRFLTGWFALFAFAIAIDAVFTGSFRPTQGSELDAAVGITFVILGDFRYFLVAEWALRLKKADAREVAARAGFGPPLVWLVALLVAFVVPLTFTVIKTQMPDVFKADGLAIHRIFLLYECLFLVLGLVLRLVVLPRRSKGLDPEAARWIIRLTDIELVIYGLWILADVIILSTQVDVGYLFRLLPNILYYAVFVPFVWRTAPSWVRDEVRGGVMVKQGDRIDRYLIAEPIGEGGMGRVFAAHDERLERRVALKVLLDGGEGQESRARLVREARAVAKLDHPNIVSVYDVGEHADGPYVVMELVQGRSLRSVIGDASIGPGNRVRILGEVARALAVAHDAGIVHRDVKPENVLLRADGRVKVLDFGIARRTRVASDPSAPTDASLSTLTAEGVKVGTPMYMAPEQIKDAKVDGRADQFAWGILAYELFVGRTPWSGDAMGMIAAILTEEPPPPPPAAQMPTAFAAVVRRALAKRPEDRFGSMHELLVAMESSSMPSLTSSIPSPVGPAAPTMQTPRVPGAAGSTPPGRSPSQPPGPAVARGYAPYAGPPHQAAQPAFSRRYNTKEVADIFDRALSAQPRRFQYDEIAEAAREVGLDEQTLHQAMQDLSRRGAVPPSDQDRQHDMMQVKRYLAIYGVLAGFFFLINMSYYLANWSDPGEIWFQYPVVCLGVPFGLMIMRYLFPSAQPKARAHSGDPALEQDVQRMTQYLRVRPEAPARIAVGPGSPSPESIAREQHGEIEAMESAAVMQRNRQKGP